MCPYYGADASVTSLIKAEDALVLSSAPPTTQTHANNAPQNALPPPACAAVSLLVLGAAMLRERRSFRRSLPSGRANGCAGGCSYRCRADGGARAVRGGAVAVSRSGRGGVPGRVSTCRPRWLCRCGVVFPLPPSGVSTGLFSAPLVVWGYPWFRGVRVSAWTVVLPSLLCAVCLGGVGVGAFLPSCRGSVCAALWVGCGAA